jgi:hypothetical protein
LGKPDGKHTRPARVDCIEPVSVERARRQQDSECNGFDQENEGKEAVKETSGWRWKTGAILLVSVSAISCLVLLNRQHGFYTAYTRANGDQISRYVARFSGLGQALRGNGEIGFLSDLPESGEKVQALYLTQYALAPVVVHDNSQLPLVVGNFHHSPPSPDFLASRNMGLVADFGNGVMLFRGRGP